MQMVSDKHRSEEASVDSVNGQSRSAQLMTLGMIAGVILIGAALRLVPHPPNFSPVAAMALFGGAYISRKSLALALPLAAMVLSDWILGFHDQVAVVYVSLAVVTLLGFWLRSNRNVSRLALATASSSVLFFLITNFSVWLQGTLYERTLSGLMACYVAALPFLQNSLAGDFFYVTAFFGAWALVVKYSKGRFRAYEGLRTN